MFVKSDDIASVFITDHPCRVLGNGNLKILQKQTKFTIGSRDVKNIISWIIMMLLAMVVSVVLWVLYKSLLLYKIEAKKYQFHCSFPCSTKGLFCALQTCHIYILCLLTINLDQTCTFGWNVFLWQHLTLQGCKLQKS